MAAATSGSKLWLTSKRVNLLSFALEIPPLVKIQLSLLALSSVSDFKSLSNLNSNGLCPMASKNLRFLDPESKKSPPNYASRSVQIKLLMLVGSLCAVIWAMQQAGQPQAWQWLVEMDQRAKQNKQLLSQYGAESIAELERSEQDPASQVREEGGTSSEIGSLSGVGNSSFSGLPDSIDWELERVFWEFAVKRMSPGERFALVVGLSAWTDATNVSVVENSELRSAISRLSNLRNLFDRQVKTSAAMQAGSQGSFEAVPSDVASENGVESDADLAQSSGEPLLDLPQVDIDATQMPTLYKLPAKLSMDQATSIVDQGLWLSSYWEPVLRRGSVESEDPEANTSELTLPPDRTLGQQLAGQGHWAEIRRRLIDPILVSIISDGSRLGRPEERASWLRTVQAVAAAQKETGAKLNDNSLSAIPVTRQNLMGQPESFRGKWVQISGTLRRVDLKRQSNREVGQYVEGEDYCVAWIQPGISSQGPYCVYCLDDPELRALAQSKSDPRRSVSVSGIFFKIYPYPVSDSKTAACPLLIASKTSLAKITTRQPAANLSSSQWGIATVVITLFAAILAGFVWISTRYRSANPIGQRIRNSAEVNWLGKHQIDSPSQSLERMTRQTGEVDHETKDEEVSRDSTSTLTIREVTSSNDETDSKELR